MSNEKTINVLYVDDDIQNLISFTAAFRRDFNVFVALSVKEAENILDNEKGIHVLITDQRMPVKTGTELLAETVKKYPHQTRILLTSYASDEAIKDAENRGQIFASMQKPWDEELLRQYVIEGYDLFYSKMILEEHLTKLKRAKKNLGKSSKKRGKRKK